MWVVFGLSKARVHALLVRRLLLHCRGVRVQEVRLRLLEVVFCRRRTQRAIARTRISLPGHAVRRVLSQRRVEGAPYRPWLVRQVQSSARGAHVGVAAGAVRVVTRASSGSGASCCAASGGGPSCRQAAGCCCCAWRLGLRCCSRCTSPARSRSMCKKWSWLHVRTGAGGTRTSTATAEA